MRAVIAWMAAALAGCAASESPPEVLTGPPVAGTGTVVVGEPPPEVVYERVVHPGDAALSVLGTPFLLAFKGIVCVASAVVAAPTSALVALSEPRLAGPTSATLGDGLAANCGPPYVISPYRYVAVPVPAEPPPPVPDDADPVPLP
ncbi:MAG TPA: hypothetical protein VFZ01_20505 [Geminicoccaceae bacterium]